MLPYTKPPMPDMIRFIWMTHKVEKLTVDMNDITAALKHTPNPNPYVVGHFDALNYLLSLIGSQDFPAREPQLITNTFQSQDTLHWLRKLHEKMTLPLAQSSPSSIWADELSTLNQYECGVLRTTPASLAFSSAPTPELVPYVLHLWLLNIAHLHEDVKDELANPYGITKAQSLHLNQIASDTVLLFANLQPFSYGSNRLGRLVENALRLHWRLPFKHVPVEHDYENFIRDVQKFGNKEIPQLVTKAKEMIKIG